MIICTIIRARRGTSTPTASASCSGTIRRRHEQGPITTRADDDLGALVARMGRRNVRAIVVTDPDGRLMGVLRFDDTQRAVADANEQHAE